MTIEEHLQNIKKAYKNSQNIVCYKGYKNAECKDDIFAAVALKEELNWHLWNDELKDQWNNYFDDAKKSLP